MVIDQPTVVFTLTNNSSSNFLKSFSKKGNKILFLKDRKALCCDLLCISVHARYQRWSTLSGGKDKSKSLLCSLLVYSWTFDLCNTFFTVPSVWHTDRVEPIDISNISRTIKALGWWATFNSSADIKWWITNTRTFLFEFPKGRTPTPMRLLQHSFSQRVVGYHTLARTRTTEVWALNREAQDRALDMGWKKNSSPSWLCHWFIVLHDKFLYLCSFSKRCQFSLWPLLSWDVPLVVVQVTMPCDLYFN